MKHLGEEKLVEYYYGDGSDRPAIERHLRICAECNSAYEALRTDLANIQPEPVPEHGDGYGESVWRAIRDSAPVYEKRKRVRWNGWATFKYAGVLAVLIAVAFIAGRRWEHSHPQITADDLAARQRLALVVLADHLDRSERLLVELKHADGLSGSSPLQSEAKELLAENRLYRGTASQLKDPMLSSSLDHLGRVLAEVANHGNGMGEADVERLQKEMNSNDLLFEIRVLRMRVHEEQGISKPKGATI